jgi:hypothetical protein
MPAVDSSKLAIDESMRVIDSSVQMIDQSMRTTGRSWRRRDAAASAAETAAFRFHRQEPADHLGALACVALARTRGLP